MHTTVEKLLNERPVLIDGAWGTELQKQGLKPGESPEALNLEKPEIVEAVAKAYVEAGSRIIITNTFGGTSFTLQRHGLADQVAEVNRLGAEISKRAAGDQALVFASMGPTGKILMMGDVEEDELFAAFSEQAQALAAGGADGLVVETMADLEEAILALKAAKETGLPVCVSMIYDSGADLDRTMMGTTVEQAAEELTAAGADIIGSNCGQGIEGFVKLAARMKAATHLPIWIKGNAGLPQMVNGQTVYKTTAADFAVYATPLLDAGADFIGGCCGTSPDFIRALKAAL
ncbi:Bifunctional homocysteine S-methyltransferase/5,10-methylenetetrahydrofolate reductase [Pontiella desulfatans]|uniref:Bifunctional homocysteine S-methyltransferase/5,10-methylenetetrahydrofolate reductase n=1 Tax=Pontiella desulfatans TaxID=2750659 RepID=A0A6C2TX01_PONDE|nr:homocysteine S-methyltransferase family protein [Pontiella desulfatans]VGO12077.1 Bifunctional homocysteine S-methyltransferase/5,10-methylenetetrahydrofolate reductase [Pontiella desulfatans]